MSLLSKNPRRSLIPSRRPTGGPSASAPLFEPLEPRELLSAADPLIDEGAVQTTASTPAVEMPAGADSPDVTAPSAELLVTDVTEPGATTYSFQVILEDNEAIDVASLNGNEVLVTGPNGYGQYANLIAINVDAAHRPIPNLDRWEQNMRSFGAMHGNTNNELNTWEGHPWYYDGEWAFYQIAGYTGDATWNASAQHIENTYRTYVLDNNGQVPGWRVFPHGLYEDYLRTGDEESKRAVLLLAERSVYAHLGGGEGFNRSRETAYAMQAYMYAEKLGADPHPRLSTALEYALGHLDQWFVSKTVPYMQPFMAGLTAHALIEYDEMYGDDRIQPLLEKAADWLWDNAWVESNQSFYYRSDAPYNAAQKPSRGAPDLNMLIAPMYAWLFNQTDDVKYLERGDAAFAGGVEGAYLHGGKQFIQSYRLSFSYVQWRQAAQSKGAGPSPQTSGAAASPGNAPQTVTYRVTTPGGAWDPADNGIYTVTLLPGQVSDTNGNFIASHALGTFDVSVSAQSVDARRFGNFEGRTGVSLTVAAANGSRVTFSLKGSGYGVVEGDSGIESIRLVGTTSRSSLKVTSKSASPEVGAIAVDGSMRSLRLKGINVTGNIDIDGTLGSLMANDVVGPGTITIGSASADGAAVSLRLNHVTDMSLNSAMPIRSIIVTGWTNTDDIADDISAPSIGKLQVRTARRGIPAPRSGAFEAGLELTGRGTVLGSARIANGVTGAAWDINGSVGKVCVDGDIEDWTMTVDSNVAALQLGNVISADVEVGGQVGKVRTARGTITGLTTS